MHTQQTAEIVHNRAVNTHDGQLRCDCGHRSHNRADWHKHTAQTYNNPSPRARELRGASIHHVLEIEPGADYVIEACTKVGCARRGNGLQCWTMRSTTRTRPDLFQLPTSTAAGELLQHGGIVSRTYELSWC